MPSIAECSSWLREWSGVVWSGPVKDTQVEGEEATPAVAIGVEGLYMVQNECDPSQKTSRLRQKARGSRDAGPTPEMALNLCCRKDGYHIITVNTTITSTNDLKTTRLTPFTLLCSSWQQLIAHRDCLVFPPARPQCRSGQRAHAFPAQLPSTAPPLCATYMCYCCRTTATQLCISTLTTYGVYTPQFSLTTTTKLKVRTSKPNSIETRKQFYPSPTTNTHFPRSWPCVNSKNALFRGVK
jgi:hypothetical protein